MPTQERLINASSSTTGSAVVYLQGADKFSVRYGATSGTYTYVIRATLTENESLATGHIVSTATGQTTSTLIEFTDKQYYALSIAYEITSGGGTMSVFINTGEIEK